MTDPSALTPDRFPSLHAGVSAPERIERAIEILRRAITAGEIRNRDLQDVKAVLGRAVERAWENAVSAPFFFCGRYQSQPEAVYALYSSFLVSNLYDLRAASRKLSSTPLDGDAIGAMRAIVNELLPLAEAVEAVKNKVIKGREPREAPAQPTNPNKVVQTCPCCFRAIAVVGGRMAHHGYNRPYGMGFQTASCAGVRFAPLEVSSEGLIWLIGCVEAEGTRLRKSLSEADKLTSLPVSLSRNETIQIDPADPRWPRVLARHKGKILAQLDGLSAELPLLNKRFAEWTPA